MPARLTAFVPDHGTCVVVVGADGVATIGRAEDATLRLPHPSVSRRHAQLRWTSDAWSMSDVGSKNGTWVDGRHVDDARLDAPAWLRFGDVYCEFVPIDDAAAARGVAGGDRSALATTLILHLQRSPSFAVLLRRSLEAAMLLACAERGLLAVCGDHDARLYATAGFEPSALRARFEPACFAALELALAGDPDAAGASAWHAAAHAAASPATTFALPLVDDGETVGALCLQWPGAADALGAFDRALLDTLAQRVARAIRAHRATGDALPEPVGAWRRGTTFARDRQ